MHQAEIYANNIIDTLCITQLTVKELKKLIAAAWEAGYKAKHETNLDSGNNELNPALVSDSDEGHVIDEKSLDEIIKEYIKERDINKPAYPPYIPTFPNKIWPDPNTPLVPDRYNPYQPYPWMPIIYC